eukprot:29243-Pelagococcus_subviridis.AAC.11
MRVTAAPVPRHSAVTPSSFTIARPARSALRVDTTEEDAAFTWKRIFTRSMGAVATRDNAPAAPPARRRSHANGSGASSSSSSSSSRFDELDAISPLASRRTVRRPS